MKDEIKKIFKGDIEDAPAVLEKYSRDASLFKILPEVVVFPKDTADIQALVKWVAGQKKEQPTLSITPRSAGTCMAGGPLNDSIIMDFTRYMNHIDPVIHVTPYTIKPLFPHSSDVEIAGEATVQPGVFYRDFEKATLAAGLLLPCFTASKSINAVGGMVGNNSGGELSLRYGKTEDYVAELEVVLSDGSLCIVKPLARRELYQKIAEVTPEGRMYQALFELIKENEESIKKAKPQVSKSSAGYNLWNIFHRGVTEADDIFDLCQLFIGSQGTLGIVTKIKFRLIATKKHHGLLVVFLHSLDNLGDIVKTARAADPQTIEAYDDKTIALAVKFWYGFIKKRGLWGAIKLGFSFLPEVKMMFFGLPKLVMLIECVDDDIEKIKENITKLDVALRIYKNIHTRKVFAEEKEDKYWTIRHDSFALLREHFKGKRTAPFIDDVIVPPEMLPEFLPKLAAILQNHGLIYNMHGHAGNGNFHIIPLMDVDAHFDPNLLLTISDEVYALVLSYGGSIDAEHNDGIIRTPYLGVMFGEHITSLFGKVKAIFDPEIIFNPRKKVGGTKEDIKKAIDRG